VRAKARGGGVGANRTLLEFGSSTGRKMTPTGRARLAVREGGRRERWRIGPAKEAGPTAGPCGRKRGEKREKEKGWAGPKERKGREEKGKGFAIKKIKHIHLNSNLKNLNSTELKQ